MTGEDTGHLSPTRPSATAVLLSPRAASPPDRGTADVHISDGMRELEDELCGLQNANIAVTAQVRQQYWHESLPCDGKVHLLDRRLQALRRHNAAIERRLGELQRLRGALLARGAKDLLPGAPPAKPPRRTKGTVGTVISAATGDASSERTDAGGALGDRTPPPCAQSCGVPPSPPLPLQPNTSVANTRAPLEPAVAAVELPAGQKGDHTELLLRERGRLCATSLRFDPEFGHRTVSEPPRAGYVGTRGCRGRVRCRGLAAPSSPRRR